MKKKLTFLIISAFTSFISMAQNDGNWSLFKSDNGVEIYTKEVVCNPAGNDVQAEVILLKVVNTTSQKVRVSWHFEMMYNNACRTCNNDEYKISLELGPNQAIENTCNYNNRLIVHKKFINKPNYDEFTGFDLGKFSVLK